MTTNDTPLAAVDILAQRIGKLIEEARDAGLLDEQIAAELQDAAEALHDGLT